MIGDSSTWEQIQQKSCLTTNSFEGYIQYELSYYASCIYAFDKEHANCKNIIMLSKDK